MTKENDQKESAEELADSKADAWAALLIILLAVAAVTYFLYQPN